MTSRTAATLTADVQRFVAPQVAAVARVQGENGEMTIGNMMRVAAVLGAAVAGGASATSQSQSCPPGQLCGPQLKQAGFPLRAGVVQTEAAVDGVTVVAKAAGVAGWEIGVKNDTATQVLMVWDESSFVMSNSMSAGRLLSGGTRKIDSGKSQPPTPVPPGAAYSQYVIAEKFTAEVEYEDDVTERNKIGFNDAMLADISGRRALREKAVNGGKLYLTIDVGGEKKTWVGVVQAPVAEAPAAAPVAPENAPPASDVDH